MNISWLYFLPSFLFFVLVILFFAGFSITGFLLVRKYVERWLGKPPAQNEVLSYYISATGVVYGITLGLIAVGVWDNYIHVNIKVEEEAATLSDLYRDISSYPQPARDKMGMELRLYTHYVIHEAWPLQSEGIVPIGGVDHMNNFEKILYSYNPSTMGEQVLHASALRSFDNYVLLRRLRIQNVSKGVPVMIWWVVFFGALINLILSWLFVVKNRSLHILMNGLLGALIGALVFLIIVLDFPFRGWFKVSSEPFEYAYEQLMK
ncbi:MAG TPA: hypothetical protein VGH64_07545 [Puia sp.]|jgi:uncharacterized protein YneF (UPF0154 family)